MKTYKKILFFTGSQAASEILMALLDEEGFYAFEMEENMMAGYVEEENFDEEKLRNILGENIKYQIESIEDQNWNVQWEQSFNPVIIEDYVAIRAQFHEAVKNVKHEIIITPKMSFGTGHHATTSLMVQEMKKIDFGGKRVIDFGTGTGILAILSEMSGAEDIAAIDNDPWSIANAADNIRENKCSRISLSEASNLENVPSADIILANINKNILLQHAEALTKHLSAKGILLLSGFLKNDGKDLVSTFNNHSLTFISSNNQGDWVVLKMQKPNNCIKISIHS